MLEHYGAAEKPFSISVFIRGLICTLQFSYKNRSIGECLGVWIGDLVVVLGRILIAVFINKF